MIKEGLPTSVLGCRCLLGAVKPFATDAKSEKRNAKKKNVEKVIILMQLLAEMCFHQATAH